MRIVPKDASQRDKATAIGPGRTISLRRWYDGSGDPDDELASLSVIREARKSHAWIECDCRPDGDPQPVMTPALLAFADTYYLRRLEGSQHAKHDPDCTFFRDQVLAKRPEGERHEARSRRPSGYFSIVRPMPENVSQKPDHSSGNVRADDAEPRLARLLWTLMEGAHLNLVVSPFGQTTERMGDLFTRIRDAAATRMVAPGVKLLKHLHTFPKAFHDGTIEKQLAETEGSWPHGHVPHAYLLVYVKDVAGDRLMFNGQEPITVIGNIEHPAGVKRTGGPYLALVAVGTEPEFGTYGALRAWLQPIHSPLDFFPVMHAADRQTVSELFKVQRSFADARVRMDLGKPLFDVALGAHHHRPDFIVSARKPDTDPVTLVLQIVGLGNDEARRRKTQTTARIREHHPVLDIDANDALRTGEVAQRAFEALSMELSSRRLVDPVTTTPT